MYGLGIHAQSACYLSLMQRLSTALYARVTCLHNCKPSRTSKVTAQYVFHIHSIIMRNDHCVRHHMRTGCLHRVQLIQWISERARVSLHCCVTVVQFVSLYIQIQGCVAWTDGTPPMLSQPVPRRDCPGHMRRHRNGTRPVHQSEAGQSTEAVDPPACDASLTGVAGSRVPWWGPSPPWCT